ncbi:hypothetical protein cypCar_00037345 [Cyprinus carpio]|nr:hypothetical protein cypCar_00037345 [Cyprinus carpio]
MDPLNRVDVMHLQESLDLSVGCRRSPVKTNSMEGLDLVKKPSWCGITSGSKSVNMSESRYISKHNSPDRPEPKLGRVGSDARSQVRRFCCLCGRAGNVEGLGDLHGPYCSSGAQAVCKSDSSPPAQKQEPDCSDLDSLYSLEDGASQSVRRQRKENCSESVDCSEHWIHEDCSIWTAGIFLVKGKLYGLEEAVRLAQGTVCSYCHMVGATLGCFFKDCPNKYHFPCALQSGRRRQTLAYLAVEWVPNVFTDLSI